MMLCCAHCPVSLVSFIWDSLQASFAFHDFQFEECRQLFCGLAFGAAWSSLTQLRLCRPGGHVRSDADLPAQPTWAHARLQARRC